MTTEQKPIMCPPASFSQSDPAPKWSQVGTKMMTQFVPELGKTMLTTKRGKVRWCGGPLVAADTLAKIQAWQGPTMSAGNLIDKLVNHAERTGFDPRKP